MPFVQITIPGLIEMVTRPVVKGIISQLQDIIKIDKSTKIVYPGDTGKMQQAGTAIGSEGAQAFLSTDKYLFVEVEEDYDSTYLSATAITQNEQIPIFVDKEINAVMSPLYCTTSLSIRFKYQSSSRTEVMRWRDDIRMRLSALRDINVHDVTYSYIVPAPYLLLLQDIFNNKQRLLANGSSFEEYIASNITTKASVVSDMVGQDRRLVIKETQCRVVGIFGFDAVPEKPQRDNDLGIWTIELPYKLTYERPVMVAMRYPITVYNALLPQEYIAFWNQEYDLDNVKKSYGTSIGSFANFEASSQASKVVNFKAEIRLPDFDDFKPDAVPSGSAGVFTALCLVDETDLVSLVNLNDLGDIIIDQDILNYIVAQELPYIAIPYSSMFTLSLYINGTLQDAGSLIVDSSLNVKSTKPLNLKDVHHVRLSLMADLSLVYKDFYTRILNYPMVIYKLVATLNESLRNHPGLVELTKMDSVTVDDFNLLFAMMMGLRYIPKNGRTMGVNTSSTKTPMSTIYSPTAGNNLNSPIASIQGQGLIDFANMATRINTVQIGYIVSSNKA